MLVAPTLLLGAEVEAVDLGMLESDVRPFFNSYCVECHQGESAEAGVRLDELPTAADFIKEPERWRRVVGQIRAKGMPPEEAEQPSDDDRAKIVRWLGHAASNVDCSQEQSPGRPTLRRLNRVEYNNTIRDLLGVDVRPADQFPADDVGEGFDNVGDVLSISPILMEKYLDAAEVVARRAIVVPREIKPVDLTIEGERSRSTVGGGTALEGKAQRLSGNGELYQPKVAFPAEGTYAFRLRAFGEQAGDEPVKVRLTVEGSKPVEIDVPATEAEPGEYTVEIDVNAGKRRVAIEFLNDFYQAEANADRNLIVDSLHISGPTRVTEEPKPASHERVIFQPIRPDHEEEDLRTIFHRLARRAFRRPPTDEEVNRLVKIAGLAKEAGEPVERGVQWGLEAVLASPHFLFKVETDPEVGTVRELNDHELATRLSYFLWSSMPDDRLFELADMGTLHEEEILRGEVDRMIADDRIASFVENFAGQWLQLRNLELRQPDMNTFPGFDDKLRAAMRKETELFFGAILQEKRSIRDLLVADFTFVNQPLAAFYGMEEVKGKEFQRVSVGDKPRGGILTHASILTLTSDPTRTSPVKRGKWVLETILGSAPPEPPPNVPELESKQLKGTLRQRMEQHRSNPACASCHAEMDPLGFGLENFDAIGVWRDKDGEEAIDASGKLPDGSNFTGPIELAQLLAAREPEIVRALTEKMLVYALGRGLDYHDTCEVRGIVDRVQADDGRLSRLVWEIILSRPFRFRGPVIKG